MGRETSLQDPWLSFWDRLAVPPIPSKFGNRHLFLPRFSAFPTCARGLCHCPAASRSISLAEALCLLSPNLQSPGLGQEGRQSLWAGAALAGPGDSKGR